LQRSLLVENLGNQDGNPTTPNNAISNPIVNLIDNKIDNQIETEDKRLMMHINPPVTQVTNYVDTEDNYIG
jgi:hypothetical protein